MSPALPGRFSTANTIWEDHIHIHTNILLFLHSGTYIHMDMHTLTPHIITPPCVHPQAHIGTGREHEGSWNTYSREDSVPVG